MDIEELRLLSAGVFARCWMGSVSSLDGRLETTSDGMQ